MYLLVIGLKMLSVTTGSLLYVSLILKHLAVLSYLSKYLSLFVISDIFWTLSSPLCSSASTPTDTGLSNEIFIPLFTSVYISGWFDHHDMFQVV